MTNVASILETAFKLSARFGSSLAFICNVNAFVALQNLRLYQMICLHLPGLNKLPLFSYMQYGITTAA